MIARRLLIAFTLLFGLSASADAQEKSIIVASTTLTQDSGLFGHLLPIFKAKTGINVKVVAQGTGQALQTGRRGDADVVFVHAKPLEEQFVTDGFGVKRYPVMYNDFILVGPKSDPARAKGRDIVAGLTRIKAKGASFISRGDRSDTHAAELNLWKIAKVDITQKKNKGPWYKAKVWDPHSTPQRHQIPTCLRTGAHGCRSRTVATSRLLSKPIRGCSTSMASSS